jgi:hypothetical protein
MRPTKFTPELAKEITDFMRAGAGYGQACQLAGITRQTAWNWRKRGREEGEGAYYKFDIDIGKIEAGDISAAERKVKSIIRSEDSRYALNAATWYLERRAPDEYGRKDQIKVQVEARMEELVDAVQGRMDPDAFRQFIEAAAEAQGIEFDDDDGNGD